MTSSVLPLSAERPHLRNLSDDATGERADGNPSAQIIGNASPLGISPDDGPEGAVLAPPGFVSTLFCSQDHGASSSFLLSSHDVHPEGGA